MMAHEEGTTVTYRPAVIAGLALSAASTGPLLGQGPSVGPLLTTSYEEGDAGFGHRGEAEFVVDDAIGRSGTHSLRVTIAPGTALAWQQWYRDFAPARRGDEFQATVWVKSEGIADGTGAYMAMEFVDDQGQRLSVRHSKIALTNGAADWEELTITAPADRDVAAVRASLVLNSVGTAWFDDFELERTATVEPWPDLGDTVREITVSPTDIVLARFGGVGFHAFFHTFPASDGLCNTVLHKRWREMRPSFARLNDSLSWDRAKLDDVARHILMMKDVGTEVYLTTWDPPDTQRGEERREYARHVVDNLEYLIREKGSTNIHYYCMTNELSLNGWGALASDMPKFRDYHQAIYDELQRRRLDVKLLASDASPVEYWHTIQWAADNMDAITGIYGGHHYISNFGLEDELFYPWFLEKCRWGAGIAHGKGKDFILGEFGCRQDGRTIDDIKRDTCIYWDTEKEPLVGIQLAEAVVAAVNAGVYGMGNWTFADFPDDYSPTYINKWGTFRRTGEDYSTRDHYYGYGLLTRHLRGPAAVHAVTTNDPCIRAAALRREDGGWSIVVVNRCPREVPLSIGIAGADGVPFRKYVYDPAHVPQHPFGDLQPPAATLSLEDGGLRDSIAAGSLAVYVSGYDAQGPGPVGDVRAEYLGDGRVRVTWAPSTAADLCYYRVYGGSTFGFPPDVEHQMGSTIATELVARRPEGRELSYRVIAVDQSGNAGDG